MPITKVPVDESALLSRRDVARLLDCSIHTVRRLVIDGELAVIIAGNKPRSPWRFDRRDLARYIESRRVQYPKKR